MISYPAYHAYPVHLVFDSPTTILSFIRSSKQGYAG